MRCVTCVRYAVQVNGELTEPVVPSRGIRQGDPISPYLFLLCTEGLSSLLHQRENRGELQGIRNGRLGPPISHLLFADDNIFFAKSDNRSVDALKNTLNVYCQGSGQKINLDKSSVFLGPHCPDLVKDRVKTKLEVQSEELNDFYLGTPTSVGRSPTATFNFLYDKLWKYINGLSGRPLSRAGNEALLKAVIQAIPTFIMSCFQLPVTTCDKIKSVITNQWWGLEDGKKKIHWKSWAWLSTPKVLGGMGFRDLGLFNQAMLAKQAWRLLTVPDSLCARVLKGRYFPNSDFWHAQKPRSSSYTWRSLLHGNDLLLEGIRWGIGDGKTVKILGDNWVPQFPPTMIRSRSPIPAVATVSCLMNEESPSWNHENVHAFFEQDVAAKILQVPISRHAGEDFVCWPYTVMACTQYALAIIWRGQRNFCVQGVRQEVSAQIGCQMRSNGRRSGRLRPLGR